MRMFRKLREGVVASHRLDAFAIEGESVSVRVGLPGAVPEDRSPLEGQTR